MPRYIKTDEFEKRIKPYDTNDPVDKALYNFAHNKMMDTSTADVVDKEKYDRLLENATIIAEALNKYQTAEGIERKKGKWIWMGDKGDSRFMCSVCKCKENVPTCNGEPTIWWFCPNCGSDNRAIGGNGDV